MSLTAGQIEDFRRDGFLAPVDAVTATEAGAWRAELEAFERTLGPGPVTPKNRRKLHVRLPWARAIVEDPRITDIVASLIGPDLLIFNATFFVKDARSDAIAAWHQDATFFGLQPYEHVTAWLALSEASVEAGCMRFIRSSHRRGQLRHTPHSVAGSVNAGSQAISEPLDDSDTAFAPLRPGQVSLHHTLVVHDSAANRSADRRIGFGISYIPTHVRHSGSVRMPAALVRGVDRYGHFDLEPDPRTLSAEERVAAHDRIYAGYRAGYDEQVARHQRVVA